MPTLPRAIFDNLTRLLVLTLNHCEFLTALPEGIFNDLTSMFALSVDGYGDGDGNGDSDGDGGW